MAEKNSPKPLRTTARRTRSRSEEHTTKKANPNRAIKTIGTLLGILLVLFIAISTYAMFAGDKNTARSGVSVFGIDVGGKTQDEIVSLLEEQDPLADFSVEFTCKEASQTVLAADVSLLLDTKATAEKAVQFGRKNLFSAFASMFASKAIEPVYTYDHMALSDMAVALSEKLGGSLVQHEIKIEDNTVRIHAGHAGTGIDLNEMKDKFEEAVLAGGGSYALKMAQTDPAQIDVDELCEMVYAEPQDAHYTVEGKTLSVTPEVTGKILDKAEAAKKLAGFGPGSKDVILDLEITEPKIKAEDINKSLFNDVLGSYATNYMTSNAPRANNVELAARYVDGTILLPGDEFSYNNTVGPRTAERGFRAASVYENNKMVDGLGGGICQTSSTIYAAVLYADLEVTERHEHSLEVHYAPLGMDATVSYGSLDFRFKNNTAEPVKISAKAGGGTVRVQILGTDPYPNRKVEITTQRVSYVPYGTTTVNDASLAGGAQVEDTPGFNGAVVDTYKIITENGKQISNKMIHKSTYRMVNRVLRVGTQQAEAAEVQPPTADTPVEAASGASGDVVIEGDSQSAAEIYDSLDLPDGI